MGHHLSPTAAGLAAEAFAARDVDLDRCLALGRSALAAARREGDLRACSVACRALALAELDRGRVAVAARRAEQAVAFALESKDAAVRLGAMTTAAGVRYLRGDVAGALALLDEALATPSGAPSPAVVDAETQRGWILHRLGRWDDAVAVHERLLSRPDLDAAQRASVLQNHGCNLAQLDRFDEALDAFDEAVELLATGTAERDLTDVMHNRALCLADAGRLPESLAEFAAVEARLAGDSIDRAWLLVGQADALLSSNLSAEALPIARRAVEAAGARGPLDLRAEAWWRVARAAYRSGATHEALLAVRRARRSFEQLGSSAQVARARHEELTIVGRRTAAALRERLSVIEALRRSGQAETALRARVDAHELALALGDHATADRVLRSIRSGRERATALGRSAAWLAEARAAASAGDGRGVRSAAARGLDTLDDHSASFGSTELRATAAGLGRELASVALGQALDSGRPHRVLDAAERWRAGSVLRAPVVHHGLAAELAALRRAVEDGAPTDELIALEGSIRRLARQASGPASERPPAASSAALRRAVSGRAVVEIVEHEGSVHAVVVTERGSRLVALGEVATAAASLAALAFALRRLARTGVSAGIAVAAGQAVDAAVAELAAQLWSPVAEHVGAARTVVVVPPAALHAVPWDAVVEAGGGPPVLVAPSATWWLSQEVATPVASVAGRVALIAGPRLPGAAQEVGELAELHREPVVLDAAASDEASVSAALDGADLAHLACHARLRADHPHLSCLELADGSFTVYDLERLRRAPTTVVLSACDSGVSSALAGDELLGFVTALLSLGTRTIVASVVPVPDRATRPLMLALHRHLLGGADASAALRAARAEIGGHGGGAELVAATAFVAFGASPPGA